MKKFITVFITLILSLSVLFTFGCVKEEEPEYSTEYSYDDSYHWRAEINGDGYIDYEAHVNNKGKCKCGKYFECKELQYQLRGDTLMCLGDNDGEKFLTYKHILIPTYAQYEGKTYPVTAINSYAFKNELIESVKMSEGLLSIGTEAFGYTINLKEVVVPDSVTSYGTSMMYNAKGIEKFVFGDGCEFVPNYMFYSCVKLKEVILSPNTKKLGVVAFSGVESLKYVVIPKSVEIIAGHNVPPHNDFGPTFNTSKLTIFMEHEAPEEGFHVGWNATGKFYYKGQWQYDENGVPQII